VHDKKGIEIDTKTNGFFDVTEQNQEILPKSGRFEEMNGIDRAGGWMLIENRATPPRAKSTPRFLTQ
jgi:hypothetical protein